MLNDAAITATVFHHSVLMPFIGLDERAGQDILVDRDHNDICLAAADICVSCYHLVERISHSDRHLASRLRSFRLWKLIGDIANTRKHFVRNNKAGQVRLYARFMFELNAVGYFGFLETQVIGVTSGGNTFDVSDLIGEFIEHYRVTTGSNPNGAFGKPQRVPQAFRPEATLRFTAETTVASTFDGVLVRRSRAGGPLEAVPGYPIKMRLELDLASLVQAGRWNLEFDMGAICAFIDQANASGAADATSSVYAHPPALP